MNMKITKYKNISSADALKNRLLRLEKILHQLMQSSGNNPQNNPPIVNMDNNGQGNLLANLALSSGAVPQSANINKSTVFSIRPEENTPKFGRNSLLLSHGQIIAELASAIARSSRRNS